ncbi:MAG TPA: hypothetical protein VK808_01390 [Bacteroidia bacterium]|nr:hypothetical protein [Bacteroidia bacterium]
MRFKLFIVLWLCLIFSGITTYAQLDTLTYSLEGNTLQPNLKFPQSNSSPFKQYFNYRGIKISKYYEMLDSLAIDSKHRVLILSTIVQQGDYSSSIPISEGKRLLVILRNTGGKWTIDYVNENVILNTDYSQSEPYQGIKRDSAGFSLKYFIGSVNKCTFIFHFKLEDDNFYLNKYLTDCYKIDLSSDKKKEHSYKDKIEGRNLQNIRIEGYLQVL